MDLNSPIGVFDSGIGGLSVLKQLIRFLPSEKFIYLGDIARVPYGNKSETIVKQYARECTKFMLAKDVKLIVVACNTVSSVAIDEVKNIAHDTMIIDMIEPASIAAVRSTRNGNIGIIGTRATIKSDSYPKMIKKIISEYEFNIISKACPLFVPLIEEGLLNHPATRIIAEEYLAQLKDGNIDTLILGCTHYPLLSQLISEILPGVQQIDTGEQAAVVALRKLALSNLIADKNIAFNSNPDIEFYVTDLPQTFNEIGKLFLGFEIQAPQIVSLGI